MTTRDMTAVQFNAALKRNGFTRTMWWAVHKDFPRHSLGLVVKADGSGIVRRASIALLLRRLRELRAEEAKKQPVDDPINEIDQKGNDS